MKTVRQVQNSLRKIREKIQDINTSEVFCEIEACESYDPGEFCLGGAIREIDGTLAAIERLSANRERSTMTVREILKVLEEVGEKLAKIAESEGFEYIESHPEFSSGDITLGDCLQGTEEIFATTKRIANFDSSNYLR